MTAIERTAYPRFKRILSAKDLEEVYTPTPAERFLALRSTKGTVAEIGFLILLRRHPAFCVKMVLQGRRAKFPIKDECFHEG